jgi:hypothetical protein
MESGDRGFQRFYKIVKTIAIFVWAPRGSQNMWTPPEGGSGTPECQTSSGDPDPDCQSVAMASSRGGQRDPPERVPQTM